MFESGDATFNTGPPTLTSLEPALFLLNSTFGGKLSTSGQNHLLNPQSLSRSFVGGAKKAPISCGQSRKVAKDLLMACQGGQPLSLVPGITDQDRVIADDSLLNFVQTNQSAKFIGPIDLALADQSTVLFKKAEDLMGEMDIALKNPGFSLLHDLAD